MSNAGCKPNAKRPMYVATTEAMPSGMSVRELAAGSIGLMKFVKNVEPICMMGPSRPTDPPDPIEKDDARILTPATDGRMRPLL